MIDIRNDDDDGDEDQTGKVNGKIDLKYEKRWRLSLLKEMKNLRFVVNVQSAVDQTQRLQEQVHSKDSRNGVVA